MMLIFLLLSTVGQVHSALTVYHGLTVRSELTHYRQVEGVAALGLGGTLMRTNFFDCQTSQGSPNDLTWRKEEGLQRFPTELIDGKRRLRMDSPSRNDVGVYTCILLDPPETVSIRMVAESSAILPVYSTVFASEGKTTELSVFAAATPPLSSDEIKWYTPRGNLIVPEDTRVTFEDSSKTLVLRNVSLEDSGSYRVEIRRLVTIAVFLTLAETNITLDVQVPTRVLSNPVSVLEASEDDNVTFTCMFSGSLPACTISWERDGRDIQQSRVQVTSVVTVHENYTSFYTVTSELRIESVMYEDNGQYRCVASDSLSADHIVTSAFAELEITYPITTGTTANPATSDYPTPGTSTKLSFKDPIITEHLTSGRPSWIVIVWSMSTVLFLIFISSVIMAVLWALFMKYQTENTSPSESKQETTQPVSGSQQPVGQNKAIGDSLVPCNPICGRAEENADKPEDSLVPICGRAEENADKPEEVKLQDPSSM